MKYQQIDIRKKILIPIILISLAGASLTLFQTLYIVQKQENDSFKKEIEHTTYAIEEKIGEREQALVSEASMIARDPAMREAIMRRDTDELIQEIMPQKANFGIDAVKIITGSSKDLLQLGPEIPVQKALVDAGLSLRSFALYSRSSNEIWITAVAPARMPDGTLVGVVIVGDRIDQRFFKQLSIITGVEIAAEYRGLFTGSSSSILDTALRYSFTENDNGAGAGFAMNPASGIMYAVSRVDITSSGGNKIGVYMLASAADNHEAKRNNVLAVLLINLAAVCLSIAAAYVVGRNITKPLDIMSKRARLIADGNYRQRIEYSGIREIDELATSFNVMSDALETNRLTLEERAYTDSLTGLFNHRFFQDNLSSELARSERYKHPLSLIVVDIDDFKKINDTFGHKQGDDALKVLAAKMKSAVRETDIACRIGGEEFAIILPETDAQEAYNVAERLRLDVSSQLVEDIGSLTISTGVATAPEHAANKDRLIEAADTAMYQAKRHGKNRTIIYGGEPLVRMDKDGDKWLADEAYYMDILYALATKVEVKNRFEFGHAEHVSAFAGLIGQELGLAEQEIEYLRIAGRLHDIGKIAVPDAILKKTARLTEKEFQQLKMHPIVGERILTRTNLEPVMKAVLYHHERLDGSGYPQGLRWDEIPLYARIIAVADVFEVLVSERPYRSAHSVEEAIAELKSKSGVKLDEDVVSALVRIVERDESIRSIVGNRSGQAHPKTA